MSEASGQNCYSFARSDASTGDMQKRRMYLMLPMLCHPHALPESYGLLMPSGYDQLVHLLQLLHITANYPGVPHNPCF